MPQCPLYLLFQVISKLFLAVSLANVFGLCFSISVFSFCSVLSLSSKSIRDNETVDQEKRENNTDKKMDMQPKSGDGGLRGVKKRNYQKIGAKQQHKFRNTLEQWFKPINNPSTVEVCQTQDNVKKTDDDGFQSNSAQSIDSQNGEEPTISDMDEETQPLTSQDLEEDDPVSPVIRDIQTVSYSDNGFEKQEVETCSASSEDFVKHNKKITDFFPGASSTGLPVRRSRPQMSSEKPDKETTSADVKPEVKWLGTPISELKRMPVCSRVLPPLKDVPGQHTVMIRV